MKPADTDKHWLAFYQQHILPFWHTHVQTHEFRAGDGLRLSYSVYRPQTDCRGLLVVSPGRIEAALKYQELVWDLAQQGYAIAILDHRGQGLSQRMARNPHKGHVNRFSDFVEDFELFCQQLAADFSDLPWFLLAHSMGGAIAALYLARRQHRFASACFTSPMFGINSGMAPQWLARALVNAGACLNRLFWRREPWYFFGMRDYAEVAFLRNALCQSEARYQVFRELYQQQPKVQLGGPTFIWLQQSLAAADQALQAAHRISVPLLLLQAGADSVVTAAPQQTFVERLPHPASRLQRIDGARHELLMETDAYRQPALQAMLAWFQRHHQ
ncbi:alpha/beta fold hydrolase [Idiomarina xiamenensis]|uniref:Lysophospholipase n=1 Tax=Idiomarina xiamenensis 10-D-4 TaxID=740709 RepID=K2KDY4_9GAMM|nr:alpha/beta fold hydrolase [Idiomarina xiamenensis]EKE80924.1 lysophospholipase [Idiomarina xiamenensis 10-D-4]